MNSHDIKHTLSLKKKGNIFKAPEAWEIWQISVGKTHHRARTAKSESQHSTRGGNKTDQ
jgi:hypothetical protein